MKRVEITTRPDWVQKVESQGLIYHSTEDQPYWNESAYYAFSEKEINLIEAASTELHEMCLEAAQHIIDNDRFSELSIPDAAIPAIKSAWDNEPPAIYGRFDLAYDGHELKLLEYNADTPTALLEASVIQWHWLQECFPRLDQFNSIHEKLLVKWQDLKPYIREPLHFAYLSEKDVDNSEDIMTTGYLMDLALQQGIKSVALTIEDIGWDERQNTFVNQYGDSIQSIFKLYPWEWLLKDDFAKHLLNPANQTQWIEPIWKMLLSNKGILPILWELFPGHPHLLECYRGWPQHMDNYVRKPLLSREGANISVHQGSAVQENPGPYGDEGFVYQAIASIPNFNGAFPILGSWIIDGVAAGIGIRESNSLVTNNMSCFVPHLIQ